jgi:branched-chain amino acid transport system ATP-binding protein
MQSCRPAEHGLLLEVTALNKAFAGIVASDRLSFDVGTGELHAIIGPNGAGKTTLVNQIAGQTLPDSGSIRFAGRDITWLPAQQRSRLGLARSFQITELFLDFSTIENVALAVQAQAGHSFRFWRAAHLDAELRKPARDALARVGLLDRADIPASRLSHGEHRLLELAIALSGGPRMLILDEPMAGLGPEESTRMIALLRELKGQFTILLIEHDMDAVFALADRITVLLSGRVVASDVPTGIRANAEVQEAYLGSPSAGAD